MKVIPNIHPWIRVNRLIRDIPGGYVSNDNYREDARNFLEKEVVRRGSKIQEIRNREVRNNTQNIDKAILVVRKYRASGGDEYFISYESPDKSIIYGFLRLRLSQDSGSVFPELKGCALMRECHSYGKTIAVKDKTTKAAQHMGFGKKMIAKAEELSISNGYKRISVIAGVGVRNYYRKQGYLDAPGQGYFQIKDLVHVESLPCEMIFCNEKVSFSKKSSNYRYWYFIILVIVICFLIFFFY
jgi:ELP3 family radical SAM enzyme/protein acetyltransferase